MPVGNWNLQWLNHNSQRSYPLAEVATKLDATQTIRIPDSFIVGLYLPISATTAVDPTSFFISSLLITPTGFNIVISHLASGDITTVAAANIPRAEHVANRAYAIGGIDAFADSIGQIVIGDLAEVDRLPAGLYTFNYADSALEADTIRPDLRAVSRLQVVNNAQTSDFIYGDVVLVAGSNIRIDVNKQPTHTEIVFKAISGDNLNEDCACELPDTAECIRCINGVCSEDGNFIISYNECIEVEATGSGLTFSDTCAAPCCGCAELDAITAQINRFGDGVATLQNFVTRLGSEVAQMNLVIMGSRLGDSGCAG